MERYVVDVKCPYCGVINQVSVNQESADIDWTDTQLTRCDIEFGGCDEEFVFRWQQKIEIINVYELVEKGV